MCLQKMAAIDRNLQPVRAYLVSRDKLFQTTHNAASNRLSGKVQSIPLNDMSAEGCHAMVRGECALFTGVHMRMTCATLPSIGPEAAM